MKHGTKATKRKYRIGFNRLKKKKLSISTKTTVDIDDFIVELAFSGRLALGISIEIRKKKKKIPRIIFETNCN